MCLNVIYYFCYHGVCGDNKSCDEFTMMNGWVEGTLLTRYHQLDMNQERYLTPNSIHSHLLRQSKRFWFVGWGWFCEGEEGMLREQTNQFRAVVPNVTDAAPCSKWCRRNWTS